MKFSLIINQNHDLGYEFGSVLAEKGYNIIYLSFSDAGKGKFFKSKLIQTRCYFFLLESDNMNYNNELLRKIFSEYNIQVVINAMEFNNNYTHKSKKRYDDIINDIYQYSCLNNMMQLNIKNSSNIHRLNMIIVDENTSIDKIISYKVKKEYIRLFPKMANKYFDTDILSIYGVFSNSDVVLKDKLNNAKVLLSTKSYRIALLVIKSMFKGINEVYVDRNNKYLSITNRMSNLYIQ